MRPSSKNPDNENVVIDIDEWLSDITGVDTATREAASLKRRVARARKAAERVTTIRKDRCVSCKTSVNKVENNFRDALSLREYSISGLCQTCQDKIYPDFQ